MTAISYMKSVWSEIRAASAIFIGNFPSLSKRFNFVIPLQYTIVGSQKLSLGRFRECQTQLPWRQVPIKLSPC